MAESLSLRVFAKAEALAPSPSILCCRRWGWSSPHPLCSHSLFIQAPHQVSHGPVEPGDNANSGLSTLNLLSLALLSDPRLPEVTCMFWSRAPVLSVTQTTPVGIPILELSFAGALGFFSTEGICLGSSHRCSCQAPSVDGLDGWTSLITTCLS